MFRFPKGSIVRHKTGQIKGVVLNVFEQGAQYAGYYIKWDDGNHSYHAEKELVWANIDRPSRYPGQPSAK
ncbi:hypothetical protein [Erwinia persicina]|uniref:hypothetical protein n=1 Tax=Erwinia persicina TaxID=55211 RepID=UPI001786C55D|nr:hypothetical protein [Erwinia persicina]MBD8165286.1 hypothetical protein [Erwinia persicina]MBD8213886.1 hypothetical protein [Erwinia persicina]